MFKYRFDVPHSSQGSGFIKIDCYTCPGSTLEAGHLLNNYILPSIFFPVDFHYCA